MRSYAPGLGTVSENPLRQGAFRRNVMATAVPPGKASPDVVVVGGGVIGLSVALMASRSGRVVRVIDPGLPGRASRVAAGLLAPSLGATSPPIAAQLRAARDAYGRFIDTVKKASGFADLAMGSGIL